MKKACNQRISVHGASALGCWVTVEKATNRARASRKLFDTQLRCGRVHLNARDDHANRYLNNEAKLICPVLGRIGVVHERPDRSKEKSKSAFSGNANNATADVSRPLRKLWQIQRTLSPLTSVGGPKELKLNQRSPSDKGPSKCRKTLKGSPGQKSWATRADHKTQVRFKAK